MNSDLKPCGNFTTSDKTLTALQDMTLRSDLANFYYFPTDCPQREKNGWTADEKPQAFSHLLDFIKAADDHINLGVLGDRVIFHVLSDFGHADLALKMITRPDFPSYGYIVEQGFNTLWERFTREPVDSVNHHFWGDITAWFVKALAGLDYNPTATDLKHVDIKPHIVENLNDAAAYYDSNYGRIESSWVKKDGKVTLTVNVPDGMTGVIAPQNNYRFEDGSHEKPLKSGEYTIINA